MNPKWIIILLIYYKWYHCFDNVLKVRLNAKWVYVIIWKWSTIKLFHFRFNINWNSISISRYHWLSKINNIVSTIKIIISLRIQFYLQFIIDIMRSLRIYYHSLWIHHNLKPNNNIMIQLGIRYPLKTTINIMISLKIQNH